MLYLKTLALTVSLTVLEVGAILAFNTQLSDWSVHSAHIRWQTHNPMKTLSPPFTCPR